MKKILVLVVLLALGSALAPDLKAQFAMPVTRQNANLVDRNGVILTDDDIIDLVGQDIYEETVVGARRQLRSGKALIIGGAAGIGTGMVLNIFAHAAMAKNKVEHDRDMMDGHRDVYTFGRAPGLFLLSAAFSTAGVLALGGGIAFRSIGKARLSWVAEQCNPRTKDVVLQWSATPGGAGLVMRF
jgi:hypothetical protein